jgi:putative addiction module CopG family antidote
MTIHLTPEQERRIQAVIGSGVYASLDEVVEAALSAVEERSAPGFEGADEELERALAEGLNSPELTEEEFWGSVETQTAAMLDRHRNSPRR